MRVNPKFLYPQLAAEPDIEAAFEDWLRQQIDSGKYKVGLRLPNTLAWAQALGVNDRRVHRVLARLAAQGLLERRPRLGTYVNTKPKRRTVVILIGSALVMEPFHHLRKVVEMLLKELRQLEYEVEVIDDLFSLLINDFEEQERRIERFRNRLIQIDPAGYVECSFDLSRLPGLYPQLERPLVSFYPTSSGGDVFFDQQAFVRESLKYLASRGRRKVMFIRSAGRLGPVHHTTSAFWAAVKDFGFIRGAIRELYHSSATDSMEIEASRWIVQLSQSWQTQRKNYVPDCLVVSDDILMRGLAVGLIQAGIQVPKNLLVVVMANEEIRFSYGISVVRCELPLRALAQSLVSVLDARMGKKKSVPTPVLLKQIRMEDATG